MSALPPDDTRTLRHDADHTSDPIAALAARWEELHLASEELAAMAALSPEHVKTEAQALPPLLSGASDNQKRIVQEGIEDIDAIMQPGLTALRVITARGKDTTAPALALWREFLAARDAVLRVAQA